jgi:hypothetical protein
MTTTNPDTFTADRAAWVAAGRPADPSFAHWARVLEDHARRQAGELEPVLEPLVRLG